MRQATSLIGNSLAEAGRRRALFRILVAGLALAAAFAVALTPSFAQTMDHDVDDDGLIEVSSQAQLEAISYDPDGDGVPTSSGMTAYNGAFSGLSCTAPCRGYELIGDIALDASFTPIGQPSTAFTGEFYGYQVASGGARTYYSVTGLSAAASATNAWNPALFAEIGTGGLVEGVRITGAAITDSRAYASGNRAGLLAAVNRGTIRYSSAVGSIAVDNGAKVGGLVGENFGTISASYARISVTNSATSSAARTGGLAGENASSGQILASYAAGSVEGAGGAIGGLVRRERRRDQHLLRRRRRQQKRQRRERRRLARHRIRRKPDRRQLLGQRPHLRRDLRRLRRQRNRSGQVRPRRAHGLHRHLRRMGRRQH